VKLTDSRLLLWRCEGRAEPSRARRRRQDGKTPAQRRAFLTKGDADAQGAESSISPHA